MTGQAWPGILAVIESACTESGEKLADLSAASPVLLVFLRHAGCTFCREALGDISHARPAIEGSGTRIILVYMGDSQAIGKLLDQYGLTGVDRICDSQQQLYRAFGLQRGTPGQLFGPKVMWRGLLGGVLARHGIGRSSADVSQMPGVFLIRDAAIVRRFRHRSAADKPDYAGICS